MMQEPKRLLVVSMNQLGDTVFTTPAMALLRARFPAARIEVQAGERGAAILAGNNDMDRILVRPSRQGLARNAALLRALWRGRYDAVVLFQSNVSYAALTAAAGVPIRAGFAQNGCDRFLTHPVAPRRRGEHIVDSYIRLVRVLGAAAGEPPPLKAVVAPGDAAFAEAFWRSHEMALPVAGLVIGTTRPQKGWPEEYWATLSDQLWQASGVTSLLLGGPEEAGAGERIRAMAKSALVNAVGGTSPGQLAALAGRCDVVVSGDTGPLHIATALQVPVVALFGSTSPAETGPWTSGKNGIKGAILYDALPCAPCGKAPTCGGRFDCMRALVPQRVYEAVTLLLGSPRRRASPLGNSRGAAR